jgi:hypothetical protein
MDSITTGTILQLSRTRNLDERMFIEMIDSMFRCTRKDMMEKSSSYTFLNEIKYVRIHSSMLLAGSSLHIPTMINSYHLTWEDGERLQTQCIVCSKCGNFMFEYLSININNASKKYMICNCA